MKKSVIELIQELLEADPQAAIIMGEILGPPLGLGAAPPRLWEEPDGG